MENKEDVAEVDEVTAAAASLKKPVKKKKKKEKKKDVDDSERNDDDDDDVKMAVMEKTKKKKSKAPASGIGDDGGGGGGKEEIELVSPGVTPGGKTKKKKKKKDASKIEALADSLADTDLIGSPKSRSKKNAASTSHASPKPKSKKSMAIPSPSPKPKSKKSLAISSSKPKSKKSLAIPSHETPKSRKKKSVAIPSPVPTPSPHGGRRNMMTTSKDSSVVGSKRDLLISPPTSETKLYTVTHADYDKYSVEYFQAILEEMRSKCERKLKLKAKDKDAFAMTCQNYYDAWVSKQENDRWLTELIEGNTSKKNQTKRRTNEQLIEAQTEYAEELDATVLKRQKWCIKSALSVFMGLKEDSLTGLEEKVVKGAIIAQATPEKLADFASKSKQNEKLLKRLFGDAWLMKEMLLHGGAVKYEYGEAIRIYVDCMEDGKLLTKKSNGKGKEKNKKGDDNDEDGDDEWTKIHRKIALACALELASPLYEFDSTKVVDPVVRYKHFVEAHRAGELDPAFEFFSVWEMRQIVNCDAPDEQMSWCRKMVMNYVPHLTCLTDETLRYVYLLHSDVRIRKPEWKASPRTYPMVLSGGGNESVNSWFGRFVLKSFGLPSWGTKFRRKEGYTRWTPEGWVALNGADWGNCSWRGKTGKDFKTEVEARNKAPPEEYFKRLVTLQCLADIIDGNPNSIPEGEKEVLHADRMWRSMAIVSMELLFQTEPENVRTFEREGDSVVVTKCEKYLEKFQNNAPDVDITYNDFLGACLIPASRHGFSSGNTIVIESSRGGKQLNFVADGVVEYDVPDNVPTQTYTLICEVCTVSSKQAPLMVQIGDDDDDDHVLVELKIPYTEGEWQPTEGVHVEIKGGVTLRFSRPNGSLGLAVKKFVLGPYENVTDVNNPKLRY